MRINIKNLNIDLPKEGRSIQEIVDEAVRTHLKHFENELDEVHITLEKNKEGYHFMMMTHFLNNDVKVLKTIEPEKGLLGAIKKIAKKLAFSISELKQKQEDKNFNKKDLQTIIETLDQDEEKEINK